MSNLRGPGYLASKLRSKKRRVEVRHMYYDMKMLVRDLGISTPPALRRFQSVLGWCGKAVDSIADRLVFKEFRNDIFGMNEIYRANNPDTLFSSAFISALIGSCSFIYISEGADGFPRLQPIDGTRATGIIDPTTGLTIEGFAVLEQGTMGEPLKTVYFTKDYTAYYDSTQNGARKIEEIENKTGHALLVPVIYRPDAVREFGRSRISRACMDLTQGGIRTLKRSEISAEFFSFPQKWISGTDPNVEAMDKWKAAMSAMIEVTMDKNGNHPQFGQFQQQSMAPHMDQFKMFAQAFAGETGLTLYDLGVPTENPPSQEGLKASHENLRLTTRKAQESFKTGLLNAGYLGACLRDGEPYKRYQIAETVPVWEPIFEPDASSISLIGDGAIKLNNAVPGFVTAEMLEDITGLKPIEKGKQANISPKPDSEVILDGDA